MHIRFDLEHSDVPVYHMILSPDDDKRRSDGGPDLEVILSRLLDPEALIVKNCPHCHATKPVYQFSQNADEKNGRNRRCRECEARRKRAHDRRKRSAKSPSVSKSIR